MQRVDLGHDNDLRKRVLIYLAGRYRSALKQLEVCVEDGTVTLKGQVGSFHEKQLALHSCRRVAGVRNLVDDVTVAEAVLAN